MRDLIPAIFGIVVLLAAVGQVAHVHFSEPAGLVAGTWEPEQQPHWSEPREPIAYLHLEHPMLVCMLKVPGSPERVCY
jgi:hypothetical protein